MGRGLATNMTARLRRVLLPVFAILASIGTIVDRIFDLRDVLNMNVPPWFWFVVFMSLFFVSVLGLVYGQARGIEELRRSETKEHTKEERLEERRMRLEIFRDKVDDLIRRGADLLVTLKKSSGSQAPGYLAVAIQKWGRECHAAIDPRYPGVAAIFMSELPDMDNMYDRNLLVPYLEKRLADLQQVKERDD